MRYFPINKKRITLNSSEQEFLFSYEKETEIPVLPHPGAFSKIRKHHQHEGIDIYCEEGDDIISIEDGIIREIIPFTGEHAQTSWWNNTWSILIEGNSGSINYGEIIPIKELKEGQEIKAGQKIGTVTPVLKINKGRPMNMLHLELYEKGTLYSIKSWDLDQEKPVELKDPTQLLILIAKENNLLEEKSFKNNKNQI